MTISQDGFDSRVHGFWVMKRSAEEQKKGPNAYFDGEKEIEYQRK